MDIQCYRLVGNKREKASAYAKSLAIEVFGVGVSLPLLMAPHDPVVRDFWPMWLAVCALIVLGCGPLVLVDALTARVCITDRGISIVSAVKRLGEPWIAWEQLTTVDIQRSTIHSSVIKKVIVRGRYEVHGLGGTYWQPRLLSIPGHHPEIERIIRVLREVVPDKFS